VASVWDGLQVRPKWVRYLRGRDGADEDAHRFAIAETEPVPVDANDAGRAALNDLYANAAGEAHFAQALHQVGAADEFGDFAGRSRSKAV
jgi:hypothetical protein